MSIPPFRNEPFTDFSTPENKAAFAQALTKIEGQLGRTWTSWIGGEPVTADKMFSSRDPGQHERIIGHFPELGRDEANRAIEAAHAAFQTWRYTTAEERAPYLLRAAEKMRQRKHEFSAMMVFEVGKTWAEADADTAECIDFLEYYARSALDLAKPPALTPLAGERNEMRYIPLGVGAIIPPWNFPLAIMAGMTSAAVVTGNTVVVKPAQQSPAIAAMFVELMYEVGLPRGVLNFITGPGKIIGDAMVMHPKTRFISFTGSREVGLLLHRKSAEVQPGQIWMKRLVAEMGGKDAILVDKESDLPAAVDAVLAAAFGYQGQKCSACSRAILHQDIYDEFIRRFVPKVEAIRQGHPAEPDNFMGPVVDQEAEDKIMSYVEIGKTEGRLLAGGRRVDTGKKGHYIAPTVFADVGPDARLAKEEIFGPIVALIKVEDFEAGLRVANNTDFGLTGAVFTTNEKHKAEAIRRFHAGNFYVNRKCTGALVGVHPFGGFNMSGTDSKAGGPDYLLQFVQAKLISEKI